MVNPREMMAKSAPIKGFSQPSPDKATMFHPSDKPTSPLFLLTQNYLQGYCWRWSYPIFV